MRIETYFARPELDGRALGVARRLEGALPSIPSIRIVDVILTDFLLESELSAELFADPVVQKVAASPAPEELGDWDLLIEVAPRPGVTDTLAITAREAMNIALASGKPPAVLPPGSLVQTSRLLLVGFHGAGTTARKVPKAALEAAFAFLWNPLIQTAVFISREEWEKGARLPALYPGVSLSDPAQPELIDLATMDDAGLEKLSRSRLLALTLPEMEALRDWYRDPATKASRAAAGLPAEATDVEVEMVAQTWSEHCKHKIFNARIEYEDGRAAAATRARDAAPAADPFDPTGGSGRLSVSSLFKTYIRAATEELKASRSDLLSVFTDNAGVFRFDDETAVCVKAETHNSPSALDPYGGAITGIVGVNRDILGTGMGAEPIFNTDVLCFAPPSTPDAEVPEGLMKPRDLMTGVHRGIVDGGNQSGIPTAAGAFVFDESFLGKPLVFCGTGGIMPLEVRGKPSWEKRIEPGMLAVMVGGRVGKDGIHGATFSSLALDEGSPASAVQIGDPIIQKKMSDFLLEARDAGLYQGITDNGAGGLSSSLGEMAETAGGVRIDLDACPRKYAGLSPWEVLVSESQERMSLAVLPASIDGLLALAKRRGVEATVVGEFTDSGKVEILAGGRTVGLLDMDFLHRGLPVMNLRAEWKPAEPAASPLPAPSQGRWDEVLLAVLADPDVASKETLVRQYDHEVKASSIEKPFTGVGLDAPSDGAVLKPRYSSWRGLAIAHGIAPRLSAQDPGLMAAAAVDEAYRAYIVLGGDPKAAVALDNFCWPDPVESASNPDGAHKLAGLVRACASLKEACLAYGLPLVSGKDSMKNDALAGGRRISVKPTLLVTVVGPVGDVRKCLSTDFLEAGDLLYLVGPDGHADLGASILERVLAAQGKAKGLGAAPTAAPAAAHPGYLALSSAISGRLVRSAHDLSDGGLAVAVAESCLGGRLGAELRLDAQAARLRKQVGNAAGGGDGAAAAGPAPASHNAAMPDTEAACRLLFSEAPHRILVSVRPEDRERFERTMAGSPVVLLGRTTAEPRLRALLGGAVILDAGLADIGKAWKTAIL
jgi:phosphoribosylformylglycinamidine synthase